MKAYVITFCVWKSPGSMLQSLGLKRALQSLNCDSTLLQIGTPEEYRLSFPKNIRDAYYFPLRCFRHRQLQSGYQNNTAFIREHFDVLTYPSYKALCASYPRDGIYIAGSDQIWNLQKADAPYFFMDFARNVKKISYAASMGKEDVPEEKQELLRAWLQSYDLLSVRENEAKTALAPFTDRQIHVHIDPTFLLRADEWRAYEKPYPVKGKYILLYSIYWRKELNRQLKQLEKQTGLPVIAVKPSPTMSYASRTLYDVAPETFLWLIDHAEYVVTSSFHGAAFSAIFQKKFSAVINPERPSRLSHLLRLLALPQVNIDRLPACKDFDYTKTNARIDAERDNALQYLRDAIS